MKIEMKMKRTTTTSTITNRRQHLFVQPLDLQSREMLLLIEQQLMYQALRNEDVHSLGSIIHYALFYSNYFDLLSFSYGCFTLFFDCFIHTQTSRRGIKSNA